MPYLSRCTDDDASAGVVPLWLVLSLLHADKHYGCAADDYHSVSCMSLDDDCGDGATCGNGIHGGGVLHGEVDDVVYKVYQHPTLCCHGRIADDSFADDTALCHHSDVLVMVEEE